MDLKVDKNSVIVFDLDDTLYNELDYLRSAYSEIAQKLQPNNWEVLFLKMFSLYRSKKNVFDFLSDTYLIPVTELLDIYRNHHPKIKPFDGVQNLFSQIKDNSGKVAIITDGRSSTQHRKLEALELKPLIDKIIISEEIGTEKPNELNFRAVENAFSGRNYTYIADNLKKDFVAPNALGWNSICLIDNGKNIHKENHLYDESKYMPRHYIFSFGDLSLI